MASSYMDGNVTIPPTNTNRLIDYADKHKLPLIIGSDTNAQRKLWGNKECNKRGEELLEFLTTCGLSWANKGTTPTFLNSRGHNSIIDITITHTAECDLIDDWHVSRTQIIDMSCLKSPPLRKQPVNKYGLLGTLTGSCFDST